MFIDVVLKVGKASVCPSISFGFTYCNAFASFWWVVGAGMGIGCLFVDLICVVTNKFVVVKVEIGV